VGGEVLSEQPFKLLRTPRSRIVGLCDLSSRELRIEYICIHPSAKTSPMEGGVPYNGSKSLRFTGSVLMSSSHSNRWRCINHRSQSVVQCRGRWIHYLERRTRAFDDARPWILLCWPCPQEVGIIIDPRLRHDILCHLIPMVFLGI
jgi:hypothetical protein